MKIKIEGFVYQKYGFTMRNNVYFLLNTAMHRFCAIPRTALYSEKLLHIFSDNALEVLLVIGSFLHKRRIHVH